ncbi:MAG: hypothetical protein NC342_00750 [Pseudoflavonifractor sp.]|nr:hypothetical protein [Alloprevotella sp.]MCM1116051.1 hypothetical protein [Pseudoflavonifractor sp.]
MTARLQRILAHNIIYRGRSYPLHLAEFDSTTGHLSLRPFSEETHSTRFIPGSVELSVIDGCLIARPIPPVL